MERESFEDPATAALLNGLFVPVKVDREVRPDVDSVYMAAGQALGVDGGWPLSVFLAPDGRPFFGGTYFPPEDRWGRPGFRTLLKQVATAWKDRRSEVLRGAAGLVAAGEYVGRGAARVAGRPIPTLVVLPGVDPVRFVPTDAQRQQWALHQHQQHDRLRIHFFGCGRRLQAKHRHDHPTKDSANGEDRAAKQHFSDIDDK